MRGVRSPSLQISGKIILFLLFRAGCAGGSPTFTSSHLSF
jgi:hypothetical protein